jgi:cyanate lyase
MTRADVVERVIAAKLAKKLTWKALAEACGRSEVWATSALLGQQAMGAEEAAAVGRLLDLGAGEVNWLQIPPAKGSLGTTISTDPLIYRFHEVVQVYGTTLKELATAQEFGAAAEVGIKS